MTRIDVQQVELSSHCKRACCTSFSVCWLYLHATYLHHVHVRVYFLLLC